MCISACHGSVVLSSPVLVSDLFYLVESFVVVCTLLMLLQLLTGLNSPDTGECQEPALIGK